MRDFRRIPELAAVFAACMWGIWWIPIRFLNDSGLDGAWAGLTINIAAAILLLVYVVVRRDFSRISVSTALGAFMVGVAVATYATAISFTDVVRAVLLFYLAPAWSTIIECVFLGRPWQWRSFLAIVLSFFGMILIFSGEISIGGANIGDLMALLSGLSWSIGIAFLFKSPQLRVPIVSLVCMLGAVVVGGVSVAGWSDVLGSPPSAELAIELAPSATGVALIYFVPMMVITLWSAGLIAPALMSFLLSFEILAGVGSSALLLDEQFGWFEIGGTVFIVLGAIVEVSIPERAKKSVGTSNGKL